MISDPPQSRLDGKALVQGIGFGVWRVLGFRVLGFRVLGLASSGAFWGFGLRGLEVLGV